MNFESFRFPLVFLVILLFARAQATFNTTDVGGSKLNDVCGDDYECGENMDCFFQRCKCDDAYVYVFEIEMCLKKSEFMGHCQFSEQCFAATHTVCASGYCLCQSGYERRNYRCILKVEPSVQINKDIYKAAMVALSCFVITVIGLFVLFLCNRSYIRRASRDDETVVDFVSGIRRRPSDIFNVSEELAAMRRIDKPPNYQEIVIQDSMIRGMPPPAYNDVVGPSTSTAGMVNTQPGDLVRGNLRTTSNVASVHATSQPTQVSAVMRLMRQTSNASANNTSEPVALATRQLGADNPAFVHRE